MAEGSAGPTSQLSPDRQLESPGSLLAQGRAGDAEAWCRLVTHYLPALLRWAHGRLPARARDLADTDDLVQITLLKALNKMDGFELKGEGAFFAYLRRILLNQIRDEVRRSGRSPGRAHLTDDLPDADASPLEQAIGREVLDAYEAALAALPPQQREAVVLRIEFGFTLEQVAEALESHSVDAARMVVTRALLRLGEAMDAHG